MRADELIEVELDESERKLLTWGIIEWGGPATPTEEFAVAMGFQSIDDMFAESPRLTAALDAREPMTRFDWCRVLLATEIVFASNIVGSGMDWCITSGVSDVDSLVTLRRVQRKLTREVRGLIGNGFGSRPDRPSPLVLTTDENG
jgi:hypothetical protein